MSSNFKPQPIFFVGRPSNAEEPKPEMDTAQQPMFEPDLNVLEAIKETLKSQIKCDLSFESTLFQDPAITDIMTSVPSDDSFALNAPYVTRAADQTAYIKKAAAKSVLLCVRHVVDNTLGILDNERSRAQYTIATAAGTLTKTTDRLCYLALETMTQLANVDTVSAMSLRILKSYKDFFKSGAVFRGNDARVCFWRMVFCALSQAADYHATLVGKMLVETRDKLVNMKENLNDYIITTCKNVFAMARFGMETEIINIIMSELTIWGKRGILNYAGTNPINVITRAHEMKATLLQHQNDLTESHKSMINILTSTVVRKIQQYFLQQCDEVFIPLHVNITNLVQYGKSLTMTIVQKAAIKTADVTCGRETLKFDIKELLDMVNKICAHMADSYSVTGVIPSECPHWMRYATSIHQFDSIVESDVSDSSDQENCEYDSNGDSDDDQDVIIVNDGNNSVDKDKSVQCDVNVSSDDSMKPDSDNPDSSNTKSIEYTSINLQDTQDMYPSTSNAGLNKCNNDNGSKSDTRKRKLLNNDNSDIQLCCDSDTSASVTATKKSKIDESATDCDIVASRKSQPIRDSAYGSREDDQDTISLVSAVFRVPSIAVPGLPTSGARVKVTATKTCAWYADKARNSKYINGKFMDVETDTAFDVENLSNVYREKFYIPDEAEYPQELRMSNEGMQDMFMQNFQEINDVIKGGIKIQQDILDDIDDTDMSSSDSDSESEDPDTEPCTNIENTVSGVKSNIKQEAESITEEMVPVDTVSEATVATKEELDEYDKMQDAQVY